MGFNLFIKKEEIKYGPKRKRWSRSFISSLASITVGFIVALLIATAIGYNPFSVINGLFSVGFEDPISLFFEFGTLAIAGFAFAFASRAGIFNIGISGQMLAAGTMIVFVTGIWIPEGSVANGGGQIITLLVAITTGALVALFTGLLETFLKVNSVVTAIILNWIIYFISFYLLASNEPSMAGGIVIGSSVIPNEFRFWDTTSLLSSIPSLLPVLLTVLIIGIIMFVIFKYTVFGHKSQATGLSLDASKFAGYNVKVIKLVSFVISGAIAGILAVILYTSGRSAIVPLAIFSDSVPIEGFNGIAIALIAYNNPLGIIGISALIGLFKASVPGVFLNDSASYINLLIGFLLMGAALSIVISEKRPIIRYRAWKYGKDILQATDKLENSLSENIIKYQELYHETKLKLMNNKSINDARKEIMWAKISNEIQADYISERDFIKESYSISKIYSWIELSKSKKIFQNLETKIMIAKDIAKIKNKNVKSDLLKVLDYK